ncbi:hypothetical protein H0O02_02150 [Candidatus Micrarchaeota archaeon]|nr:hypothetical protein [Candidatus Micrarchaeota archaeon]
MGGEGNLQELKAAERPSVRERVKNAFRKALPIVVPIALVGGIAIGASVRGCMAKKHEKMEIEDCMATEHCYPYTLNNQKQSGMRELNEIHQLLIKNIGDNNEELALAFKHLGYITTSYFFDVGKMPLVKQLVESSGNNAVYSLEILSRLTTTPGYNYNAGGYEITADDVTRIAAAVNQLAQKSGDAKKDVFPKVLDSASTMYCSKVCWWSMTPKMFGVVEAISKNSASKDDILYKAEIIARLNRSGEMLADPGGFAKKICETADAVSAKAGPGKEEALRIYRTLMLNRPYRNLNEKPEDFQKRLDAYAASAQPQGLLDMIGVLAERSADSEKFTYAMKVTEKILVDNKYKSKKFDAEFANRLCGSMDMIAGESQGNWKYGLDFFLALVSNLHFDFNSMNPEFAGKIGKAANLAAQRAGGRASEAMAKINYFAGAYYTTTEGVTLSTEQYDCVDTVQVLAERSKDADQFLWHLELIIKSASPPVKGRDEKYAMLAGKLCDLEGMILARTNNNPAAIRALVELVNNVFGFKLGVVKLVEIGIGDAQGNEVIDAIKSMKKVIGYSSREISYKDYEEGAALVNAIFRAEKPDLRKVLNFSYGVSVIGAEKTREMYKIFGIEYFFRYPAELLEEASRNADPSNPSQKPLLLSMAAKTDWNNAFSGIGWELKGLTKYYRVLIAETNADLTFYSRINEVSALYKQPISVLVINGHGTPYGVWLGNTGSKTGALSHGDGLEVARLQDSFVKNPLIIFNSCSTGKNHSAIGGAFSKLLGATVFAPTDISYGADYILDAEGRIIRACYNVSTTEYINGMPHSIPADTCTKK